MQYRKYKECKEVCLNKKLNISIHNIYNRIERFKHELL